MFDFYYSNFFLQSNTLKYFFTFTLSALMTSTSFATSATVSQDKSDQPHGTLIWSDEFTGKKIDRNNWSAQIGNGFTLSTGDYIADWGNEELQYYTDIGQNSFQKRGKLHIVAKKEPYETKHETFQYTSTRLVTSQKFNFQYGRIDIRAKLPQGQGFWPALWLLPDNGPHIGAGSYGTWAASGEIDIMENKGFQTDVISGAIHYGGPWPHNTFSTYEYKFKDGQSTTDFHIYSVIWQKDKIQWLIDGEVYGETSTWYSQSADGEKQPYPAPFDKPFYLLMNVAVGGRFGGDPDETTQFPQAMIIDYVRVYTLPHEE